MARQLTDIEIKLGNFEMKLRRLKTMTLGWRSVEDYEAALAYFDGEFQQSIDAVRSAILQAKEPDDA